MSIAIFGVIASRPYPTISLRFDSPRAIRGISLDSVSIYVRSRSRGPKSSKTASVLGVSISGKFDYRARCRPILVFVLLFQFFRLTNFSSSIGITSCVSRRIRVTGYLSNALAAAYSREFSSQSHRSILIPMVFS